MRNSDRIHIRDWDWFGQPDNTRFQFTDCYFHLHTHVGNFCIITVGDKHFHGGTRCIGPCNQPDEVEDNYFYLTVIRHIKFICSPKSEVLRSQGHQNAHAANAGHKRICYAWADQ